MRRSFNLAVLAIAAFIVLALAGCVQPLGPGKLRFNLVDDVSYRTLKPSLDMKVSHYLIEGEGPGGASFSFYSVGYIQGTEVAFGEWTINVTAYNDAEEAIGSGTALASVNSGRTTTVTVNVLPFAGLGSLDLSLSWPAGTIEDPRVIATLTSLKGEVRNLSFSVDGASATCLDEAVPNGYHTLEMALYDGEASELSLKGRISPMIARIVTGQTTPGSFTLSDVTQSTGRINGSIINEMTMPLEVGVLSAPDLLAQKHPITMQASVSGFSGQVHFKWYQGGSLVGTGPSYGFGSELEAGNYALGILAYADDGSTAGSIEVTNHFGTALALSGVVENLAGSGSQGHANGNGSTASFMYPGRMVSDGTSLYVVENQNNQIRKIDLASREVSLFAGNPNTFTGSSDGTGTSASFYSPTGIATDGSYLYVLDGPGRSSKIRKIDIATRAVSTIVQAPAWGLTTKGAPTFVSLSGLATDGTYLYVTENSQLAIYRVKLATGEVTKPYSVEGQSASDTFGTPQGITTDGKSLFFTDVNNSKIGRVELSTGTVSVFAGSGVKGSLDGLGTAASFNQPYGLSTDGTALFVADTYNNRIRKIDIASGAVTPWRARAASVPPIRPLIPLRLASAIPPASR